MMKCLCKTFIKSQGKLWSTVGKCLGNTEGENLTVVTETVSEKNVPGDNLTFLDDLRWLQECLQEKDGSDWINGDNELENQILTDEKIINAVNIKEKMKMRWRNQDVKKKEMSATQKEKMHDSQQ